MVLNTGRRLAWRLLLSVALIATMALHPQAGTAKEKVITLVAVGDVNMNRHREVVKPDGIALWGKLVPFEKQIEKIVKYIDGDINFLNLETTVMDSNDIKAADKTFVFRCHPNSVRTLAKAGFNLMSIANNHIIDYGEEGMKETLKWMETIAKEQRKGRLWYAGAGMNIEEATEPTLFKVKGVRFAFGAVSISQRATSKRYGVASVHDPELALKKLKAADADVKILSMHAGTEKESKPVSVQLRVAREAIEKYDVDIVLGHHAHVPQGVEFYKGGIIFFGLGNFSMRGARNMGVAEFRPMRDFGLIGKIEMAWDTKKQSLTFRRVEALPVFDMHSGVHAFSKEEDARVRVEALNKLSDTRHLGKGSGGLVFAFRNGRGVAEFEEGKPKASKVEERKDEKKSSKSVKKSSSSKKKKEIKKEKKKDKKKKRDKKKSHSGLSQPIEEATLVQK